MKGFGAVFLALVSAAAGAAAAVYAMKKHEELEQYDYDYDDDDEMYFGDDCDDDHNTDGSQMDGTVTPAAFRCSKKIIHKKILLGEYVARRICLRYCKKLPYAGIIRFK